MVGGIAFEATFWARKHNVEAAFCWMPNAQTVLDGVVSVGAYGNDGTVVRILLDAEECRRADPDALAQVGMVFLGTSCADRCADRLAFIAKTASCAGRRR